MTTTASGDDDVLAWAEQVLEWLIERTSLLREPAPGMVEFAHTSFRDYLAAREFVDRGQIDVLLRHAHRNRWRDVVAMSMSFARPAERVRLLRGLLDGNEDSARDPKLSQRMQLVAAFCLRESPSILDADTGDDVRAEVLSTLRTWIPPSSREEAELLARAGGVVVDLLPDADAVPRDRVPFVARTLAMIGSAAALEKLAGFARTGPDVFDDLLYAWRQAGDPADYARTVLAGVDFGDYRVAVRGHARIRHLVHLRGVRVLSCVGVGDGDGDPAAAVAAMPQVHTLEVRSNQTARSLDPLRAHPGLRSVALVQCDALRSIAALAEGAVEELSVLHCRRVELDGLAGATLRRLVLAGERFDAGLADLPDALPVLAELEISNRGAPGALRGARRWSTLRRVVLGGPLSTVALDELAALPALADVVAAADRSIDAERAAHALEHRGVRVELVPTEG